MQGGGVIISPHSLRDAPTNSKFLDFSQLHPYFHLVKSFFTFFCNFYKKITIKFFFRPKKNDFLTKMVKIIFFSQILTCFVSKLWSVCFENFFEVHYMSVCQKLAMLKIRSTSVSFLSLRNLEAASEEAMQLRRLIKSSNESLWPYLFGKFEFWNF